MNEDKTKQISLELDAETAQGIYSNMVIINHSASEFIVDFVNVMPGVERAKVRSRVILTPEHAKRMLYALQDNIRKYEEKFVRKEPETNEHQISFIPKGEA